MSASPSSRCPALSRPSGSGAELPRGGHHPPLPLRQFSEIGQGTMRPRPEGQGGVAGGGQGTPLCSLLNPSDVT